MLLERLLTAALLVAALTCWGLRAAPPLPAVISDVATEWLGWEWKASQNTQIATDSVSPTRRKMRVIRRVEDDVDGQKVELSKVDGRVTELVVDGKTIPESDYAKYQKLIDRLSAEPPAPPAPPALPGMPAPPAPPASPSMGHFWEFPAAAPNGDVRVFNFSTPPPPPPPPGVEVKNEQDANGNRVIRVKRGDEEVEIIVNKDGKVLVDGEEVANGQSVGVDKLRGTNGFVWTEGEPGEPMQFEFNRDIQVELDNANKHRDEAIVRIQELNHQNQDILIKRADEMRANQDLLIQRGDEMRANQDFLIQRGDEMRANQDARRIELEVLPKVAFGDRELQYVGGDFSAVLLAELKHDYLVTDPNNYSVELTGKKFKVNGKKQPDNLHQKYLELYRRHHGGQPLTGKDGIKLEVRN